MPQVKVFVYGTLMHKSDCAGWAEEAEVAPPRDATARGDLMSYYDVYPYADFTGDGTIHGQVLTFDANHPKYYYMHRVERGAGYHERDIVVTYDDGTTDEVVGWQVNSGVKRRLHMPIILSGDWNSHARALPPEVRLAR